MFFDRRENAFPIPTIPTTFSVPPRRPRSWCPPCSTASISIPFLTRSPPAPLRPFTLCPENVSRSTGSVSQGSGTLPVAWTASVCMSTPASLAIAPISAMGIRHPVSLFAAMTETRIVSFVSALRTASGSTIPWRFTGTYVTRNPCVSRNRHVFMIAGCSTCDVTMCFPAFPGRYATPFTARLSASVPELVMTTSSGRHP